MILGVVTDDRSESLVSKVRIAHQVLGKRSEAVAAAITSSGAKRPRASAAGVRGRSPRKISDKFTPKIAWRSNLVLMHTFLQPILDISRKPFS